MCLQKPYVRKTTGIFHFWFLQTLHVPKYYFVYANNLFHVSLFVLNINMLFNYELNLLLYYLTMIALTFAFWKFKLSALQIRASQRSITANPWPLTAHIYHVMTIVTGDFSKKSFYHYYFHFVEILWNDLELVFLKLLNIRNSFLFCAWEQTFKLMTDFFLTREHFYFTWQLQGIDIRLYYLYTNSTWHVYNFKETLFPCSVFVCFFELIWHIQRHKISKISIKINFNFN